jgi:hypothetical protein
MRETILDKWNNAMKVYENRCSVVISEFINNNQMPKVFYAVQNYQNIQECWIKNIIISDYAVLNMSRPYMKKEGRPTDKELQKLLSFIERFNPNSSHVGVDYESYHSYGTIQGFKLVSEINLDNKMSFKKDDLLPIITKLKELYAPREGYAPCSYCGVQRRLEDMIQRTIISPNWKNNNFVSPLRNYCKDKPCHGYDQMAHEG